MTDSKLEQEVKAWIKTYWAVKGDRITDTVAFTLHFFENNPIAAINRTSGFVISFMFGFGGHSASCIDAGFEGLSISAFEMGVRVRKWALEKNYITDKVAESKNKATRESDCKSDCKSAL